MKKINLLDRTLLTDSRKKFIVKVGYPLGLLSILFFIFLYNVIASGEGFFGYFTKGLKGFIQSEDRVFEEARNDNIVNIALLGHGGQGHDGPNLTDSIHVISINKETKKTLLFSIPRDLLVDIPDYGRRKINHAFALTEEDSTGSGGVVASKVISDVVGLPIDYYVTVNFNAFVKLIDDFGGIDVQVPQSFVDAQYPTADYKYQTVSFERGWRVMYGEDALSFARSRHGVCTSACSYSEGTDFARAKRQQILLKAVKDKILSLKTWSNPKKIYTLLSAYKENISTNIPLWDIKELYGLAGEIGSEDIKQLVLDDSKGGLLKAEIIDGAYVLIPRQGMDSYDAIHSYIKEAITPNETLATKSPAMAEKVYVEVQNGTTIPGFAAQVANRLQSKGLTVIKVGNAEQQENRETMIYDFSNGEYPDLVKFMQEELVGAKISVDIPSELVDKKNQNLIIKVNDTPAPTDRAIDFLIILGADTYALFGLANQDSTNALSIESVPN